PSTKSSLSIIRIFEPIFIGKEKNNITEAVILLKIDQEAKRATPATAKNEAKIPLKEKSQIKPKTTNSSTKKMELKNLCTYKARALFKLCLRSCLVTKLFTKNRRAINTKMERKEKAIS